MIRTLSCHCGQVRLEVNAPLGKLTECNCSTCARHGFLHWKVKPSQVRLTSTRVGLSTYAWREISGGHHFCKTCGVAIARSSYNYLSINARCLDEVDIFTLEVTRYDGRTDMPGGDMPPLRENG